MDEHIQVGPGGPLDYAITPESGALFPLPLRLLTLLAPTADPAVTAGSTRDVAVGSVRQKWAQKAADKEREMDCERDNAAKRRKGSVTPTPRLMVPAQRTVRGTPQKTPQKTPRKSPHRMAQSIQSTQRTPQKSPQTALRTTPKRTPRKASETVEKSLERSPTKSLSRSPQKTPEKSQSESPLKTPRGVKTTMKRKVRYVDGGTPEVAVADGNSVIRKKTTNPIEKATTTPMTTTTTLTILWMKIPVRNFRSRMRNLKTHGAVMETRRKRTRRFTISACTCGT